MTNDIARRFMNENLLSKRYKYAQDYMPYQLTESQLAARKQFLSEVHKTKNYVFITECPYCANKSFTKISEIDGRGLPSEVVICDACSGCFKSIILDKRASSYHYENISYSLRGKDSSQDDIERLFFKRVRKFAYERYYFISFFTKLNKEKDLIVEYGCNDGANLLPWLKNGFNVLGIDIDPKMIEFGRRKGLNLVRGDFMDYGLLNKRPKLIILSHVLEHINDVNGFLNKLVEILDPDGYIFIETPGIKTQGLVDSLSYFDVEHNYNFDRSSLEKILIRDQFKIIYADEYIRFLCTPNRSQGVCNNNETFSMEKIISRLLKIIINIFNYKDKTLLFLLQKGARNNLNIRILNKLLSLYYKNYYRSIIKSGEKHGPHKISK